VCLAVSAFFATSASALTIYSSLPLHGDARPQSRSVVDAERLALEQAGGRAGSFAIKLVSLDDSTKAAGKWDPGKVVANARRAAENPSTIAYLGEFNSGASALSIPILNEAGILQVSPSNTYVGLTRNESGEPGEPEKYYPTGIRTYGRITPADHTQADALVVLMRDRGVRRLYVTNDAEVYGSGLARMVAARARRNHIEVVRSEKMDVRGRFDGLGRRVRRSHADGFFFGGITDNSAASVFNAVARATRRPRLFGPDGVAESRFARALSKRARPRTFITNPTLDPDQYPPAAQRFYTAFRARYHRAPQPYAIYGYEAMQVVLDSITRAGSSDRAAVVRAFFATRDRASVLGTYSIDPRGDTTLPDYGSLRVSRHGRLVFYRVIKVAR
jgi:branched-chain amino acid transport system substrate-binding protein